jgi:uncharacterized repeat protein (TIGR01451 family)
MNKNFSKPGILILACFTLLFFGSAALASAIQVQTNSVSSIQSNSAVLNGSISDMGGYFFSESWFQWGTSASYGNQTAKQSRNAAGSFSETLIGLAPNTTYHYRAAAQNAEGIVYGQDASFTTSQGPYYYSLSASKKVINLTSRNYNWSTSASASPSDILSFAITIQAPSNTDIHNVFVKDVLPTNLIYQGNLLLNAALGSQNNPASGINVGTITAGQVYVISYQAKVAPFSSFSYGTTTLSNTATITSTETGSQTASASVQVNNSAVQGITYVPAGITNKFLSDSFFLPLFLIILGSWLYFSGRIYRFADWLKAKIK